MYGQARGDVLKACGLKVADLGNARRSKDSVHCFLDCMWNRGRPFTRSRFP